MKPNFEKSFLQVGFGNILFVLVAALTTPIITRLVSPEEYGNWSVFTMYGSIFSISLMLGLDQGFVRYYYEDKSINYKRFLLNICISPAILITCICAILALRTNQESQSKSIIIVFFIYVILLIMQNFASSIVRMEYRIFLLSSMQIIQKLIYLTVSLLGIYSFAINKKWILIFATIISTFLIDVIAILPERKIWKISHREKETERKTKGIYRYGLPLMLSMTLISLFQAMGKIFLDRYSTATEVGIYSSALSIVNIFAIIQTTFTTLWTPMAIEHYKEYPDDKEFYFKINQIMTVIMFMFGNFMMLAKDLLVLCLGEKYRMATFIFPFLIFTPVMYTLSETTYYGIVFKKKSEYNIWVGVIALVINIVGNKILVPIMGAKGAAISTGIAYIAFFFARTYFSNRLYFINYHLGRFTLICIMMILLAFVSSFEILFIIRFAIFIFSILLLLILYKETVFELCEYIKKRICHK